MRESSEIPMAAWRSVMLWLRRGIGGILGRGCRWCFKVSKVCLFLIRRAHPSPMVMILRGPKAKIAKSPSFPNRVSRSRVPKAWVQSSIRVRLGLECCMVRNGCTSQGYPIWCETIRAFVLLERACWMDWGFMTSVSGKISTKTGSAPNNKITSTNTREVKALRMT